MARIIYKYFSLILLCFFSSSMFSQSLGFTSTEIFIKWKPTTSAAQMLDFGQALNATQMKNYKNLNIELWNLRKEVNILEVIEEYQKHPNIEFISPNYIYTANEFLPNDLHFDEQWSMANIGQTGGSTGADIAVTHAWDIQRKSPEVKVAIIDAGIDWKHPDLVDNIWQNLGEDADGDGQIFEWNGAEWIFDPGDENNIDDDGNGYIDDFIGWDFVNNDNDPHDDNFHGTHVAGIIGAKGNNGIGVAGITWDVQMAALKFLDVDMLGTTANAIAAINYAVAEGMPISNNSWGGKAYDNALYAALQYASNQNHLVIAAAGNKGTNNDLSPTYPAAYNLPNIVAVASTNHNDSLSDFSNYGSTSVDLAAPGSFISSSFPNDSYETISGTSMAAPHVTGASALLLGKDPTKTSAAIKNDLLTSTDALADLSGKVVSSGRLNICKLLGGCLTENLSCAYTDSLALVELYNATDGPNWTITWDLSQPMHTWHGITTNEAGCVIDITIINNQLAGSLPAEIGNLIHLQGLFLAVNQLTGSIPPQIGNLFNLLNLSLYNNQLTGILPPELGNLDNLRELHIFNNQLVGNIPEEIANLSKAKSIHLNSNQLTGSIPSTIGNLTNLTYLSLGRNLLNGSIPKEIGNMTCLESLSLITNELMGEIPPELGKLTNLKQLSLSNNKLTGDIPSELSKLTQIEDLLLSHNELTGSIPPELGDLEVLERLSLHQNQLSGCFSPQLASFCGINYNFSNNPNLPNSGYFIDFCETRAGICPCDRNTDSLTLVELYVNTAGDNWINTWDLNTPMDTWSGITINNDGCVSAINLANNGLEGTIPENLAHLTALESLQVQNNQLSGCFPSTLTNFCTITVDFSNNPDLPDNGNFSAFCTDEIGSCVTCNNLTDSLALVDLFNATNGNNWTTTWNLNAPLSTWHGITTNSNGCVTAIELNSNQLIGTIPSSMGSLLTLQTLNLANNQLMGEIPIEIYNLTNLHTLYLLSNGSLTGSISPAISNLKRLKRLNLHGNQLNNSIPKEIGQLAALQILVLSKNDLTGSIPSEITQLTQLRRLELSFNDLTGKIPTNIGELKNLTELRIGTNQLTDSIPVSIGDLSNLETLSLGTNQLSGPIPSSIGNLKALKFLLLQGNQLTSAIPVEIGMLKKLELLYLNNNQLTGSIPSIISDLSNLNYLILNNNQLSGCFPSNFNQFCDITAYDFSNNPNLPNGGDFAIFCETSSGSCASTDLVWPGDYNNDGIANYTDMLYWGLACKDSPGPARLNATTNWEAQAALDWPIAVNNVNSKYQDGDGNGQINEADLDVIFANYGLRHATKLTAASFTEGVEYQIEPKGYQGDGKIKYDIHVTLDDAPISVHGVAFTVDFNDLPIAHAYIDVTNSSINPDEYLSEFNATSNTLEVAITRSDKQNQTTNGSVGSLIVITENIGIGDPLDLDIRVGRRMKADGDFKAIASTSIQDTYVELGASSSHFSPIVYATHEECDRLGSAKIALLGGTAPYTIQWSNGQTTPEITDLTAGSYSVTATDANNLTKSYTVNIKRQYIPIYDENGGIINCVLPTTCESFLDLSDNIATNSYQAATTIMADGTITTGSKVDFKAGESITLQPGFSVAAGATFTASIETCIPNNSVSQPTAPTAELKTTMSNTGGPMRSVPYNLQIRPNPLKDEATIIYELPIEGRARLILSDMQGKPIKVLLDNAYQNKGKYEVAFTAANLAKGLYFVSLVTAKSVVTKKVILLN